MARIYGGSGRIQESPAEIAALTHYLREKAANANPVRGAARLQQRLGQMVDFMVDRVAGHSHVTESCLLQEGFSPAEIADLAPRAIVAAGRRHKVA